MKKTIFTNQIFKGIILITLCILIILNTYSLLIQQRIMSVLPLFIQAIVMFLIIKEHKYAKLGIKIWTIFIITGYGMSLVGKLIKVLLENNYSANTVYFLSEQVLFLLIGFTILYFNNKTVKVEISEQTEKDKK